jgi:hypothetical protein
MSTQPTWGGVKAALKERNYTQSLNNITEYIEVWTGKKDDVAWPNCKVGEILCPSFGNLNLGNVVIYTVDGQSGQHGDLASFTIRASNKFDDDKAIWSVDYSLISQEISGFLYAKVPIPVVQKLSYHATEPTPDNIGALEAPAKFSSLFILIPNYSWRKTADNPALTEQGWTRTERWSYMSLYGGA